MNKTKGPRLLAQSGAKGVNQKWNLEDTLIIRALWRSVKRFAAGMGCIFAALATMLFFCAPIEGEFERQLGSDHHCRLAVPDVL